MSTPVHAPVHTLVHTFRRPSHLPFTPSVHRPHLLWHAHEQSSKDVREHDCAEDTQWSGRRYALVVAIGAMSELQV